MGEICEGDQEVETFSYKIYVMGMKKKELTLIISKDSSLTLSPNWDKSYKQKELRRKT